MNNFSFILAQDGNNAVHNAAANGNLEIMELLLEYNADLEMEGEVRIIPQITVCSCHVTYGFQSESTLNSCLNVKERLARSRREI